MTRVRLFVQSIAAGVLVFVGARGAQAQTPPTPDSLPVGARVRAVTSADGVAIEGFVRAAGADSLRIGACKRCDARPAIPLASLRFLQVEQRRHHITPGERSAYLLTGGLLGAVAGGLTGGAWAYNKVRKPNCVDLCHANWLALPYGAAAGAMAGFIVGGVFVTMHQESYWVGVRLPAR